MNLGFIDPPFGDSFIGVDGVTYQIPAYSTTLCPGGNSSCCDCSCGGTGQEDKNATRNYCSQGATSVLDCTSAFHTGLPWTAGATTIHEFGHSLGMLHEHQNGLNSVNPVKLNEANVINYYTLLGMGAQGAHTNVLDFYNGSAYTGSSYDPDSIMLYYLLSIVCTIRR